MASLSSLDPLPEARAAYPLTRRQTLFWLDEQLYPDAPYHHVVLRVDLRGALDLARFRRAYAAALSAFDQFRLVFEQAGGEPLQRFRAELDTQLPLIDLRATPEQLPDFVRTRASRRFDFTRALFDAALLALGADHHVFYFCQHHIISDGSSVGLFLRALEQAYAGEALAQRPSYARYLQHERAYRESERAARDEAHFERKLGGDMPPLSFYGRTRVDRSFGVDRSLLALGEERSARFAQLVSDSRIELIDPAMSRWVALASVLFAYVSRVTGARRLVLATPVPNRSAELAETGGLLMEQTFLCVELSEAESFSSLAEKVRKELFSALRHARHSVSDRGLAYVALNLLRIPRLALPELEAEVELKPLSAWGAADARGVGDLRDTFGVSVLGFDEAAPLTLAFDFHHRTFPAALQTRAKGHFLSLFDAMLDDLDTPIAAVELVSPDERAQLLRAGRGRDLADAPPDALARIAQSVASRGTHAALRWNGSSVSYAVLAARISRLATRLAQLGVRPGVRVAFCLERGPDELVSMLATWVAGGAYVPLDIHHPAERLALILEDAAPEVLITQRALSAALTTPATTQRLLLDEEADAIGALPELAWHSDVDPAQPAYVLFTSGSTGRPKGVEISRGAIANFLRAMAHRPGLTPDDRLLAVTTTTFDIAGLELLLPLWVGATLQIADRETVLDPFRMRETLERDAITLLQATPTTFRLLLEAGFGRRPTRIKLLCGGEAISPELAERLLATGAELWNMYGPTETTVWSTIAKLEPAQPLLPLGTPPAIPIGTPIDATQVYVLSTHGALEPEGVAGELCIGGAGLALGYLGRPDLTAQRFVSHRHGPPGDRVYRTGDLARFLSNGQLTCLGRLDHQVKIRGFRIELGEIESCLRPAVGVREVIVVPRGAADDLALYAYWVGDPGAEEHMRLCAARMLPGYMQPAGYVQLDALPLNENGKVDRRRLPAPLPLSAPRPTPGVFADALEERMAGLFVAALGGREIGPEQDFFAAGGDSVRAIALRREIHATFGVELPLASMFDAPTVRGLVNALTSHGERSAPLFLELRHGRRDQAPLICVMGIALYRDLAQALDTDRAVVGLHVPLVSPSGQPPRSVEEIAARYTRLILERVPDGPYHLAGLCFGGLVAFEVAHQLLLRGKQVASLAVFDGLLPGGARYAPLEHASMLLRAPRQPLVRAGRRLRERLLARQGRSPGEPPPADPELSLRPMLASALTRAYVAHARALPLPFTLFRATQREEAPWYRLSPGLGWERLSATLSVHCVSGSHLSILRAGHVAPIAHAMRTSLQSASEH